MMWVGMFKHRPFHQTSVCDEVVDIRISRGIPNTQNKGASTEAREHKCRVIQNRVGLPARTLSWWKRPLSRWHATRSWLTRTHSPIELANRRHLTTCADNASLAARERVLRARSCASPATPAPGNVIARAIRRQNATSGPSRPGAEDAPHMRRRSAAQVMLSSGTSSNHEFAWIALAM